MPRQVVVRESVLEWLYLLKVALFFNMVLSVLGGMENSAAISLFFLFNKVNYFA